MSEWLASVPGVLTALAAIIPLVIQLVKTTNILVKEKRWSKLMQLATDLIAVAEEKLATGEDRKAWVMAMIKASAEDLNISYDEKVISDLIDSLVAMSKKVNVPAPQEDPSPESEGVA